MRRGQRQALRTVPNRRKVARLSDIVPQLVYTCELPPSKALSHKFTRILKRLAKGEYFLQRGYNTGVPRYQWVKRGQTAGMIKSALVDCLIRLGYIARDITVWIITAAGLAVIGVQKITKTQQLALGAARATGETSIVKPLAYGGERLVRLG